MVVNWKAKVCCNAFLKQGKLTSSESSVNFYFCKGIPLGVLLGPRKSISLPKWHFTMVRFKTAFCMHLETARKLLISCSGKVAVMHMSSTYCAHWYALMVGSD